MPTAEKIPESLIATNINRAVTDVFKTMLRRGITSVGSERGHEATPWPPLPARPKPEIPLIVGMVGFIGDVDGFTYVYMDEPFAKQCVGSMIGISPEEAAALSEPDIKDAIGELTNMIVGSFKNGLCDMGFPCKLTIPSILIGCDFSVGPTSAAERYIYVFDCGGNRVVADILMKSEE
jgi:chemotaxis protein CheX